MAKNLQQILFEYFEEKIEQNLGIDLVDVEYIKEEGQWFLRFYIDKKGGVTLDDCQAVSIYIDPMLDQLEAEQSIKIPHAYHLEVSSPGLNRALKRPKDFERYLGEMVEITLYKALDGKKKYIGALVHYDLETEEVEILLDEEKLLTVEKEARAKIKRHFLFDEKREKGKKQ